MNELYEEGEKLYPQGHMRNLSFEEQEAFQNCFNKLRNLSKEEKAVILKNRKYAFSVLATLDGYSFERADFSQIAHHITYLHSKGRRITKRDRAITERILKEIIYMLVVKGQIEFRGGYYSLTEKGRFILKTYRGANAMYDAFIHATDRNVGYIVLNDLSYKFFCEHNVRRASNPFRKEEKEDAEKVGMFVYEFLIGKGILIEYDDFKKQGVTDEAMYYIEAEIFIHFKKLMALRVLKSDD